MAEVRDGDPVAFRLLLARYWSPLLSYALGFVDTRDSAEDVVQETFVRVWQHRRNWTPISSPSAYLYRITRNLALDERRRRQVHRQWVAREELKRHFANRPPGPEEAFAVERLRREIEEAIDALPERRREVFVLARFHRLSHREIAEALGISVQTVANHVSTALSNLKDALSHHLDVE